MADGHDELDLLAFRYVAGEMTAEESRDFEDRLAGDQATRLAVSRMVGLTQILVEASPPLSAPVVRPGSAFVRGAAQALGWMAIGAAVAVCLVDVFSRPIDGPNMAEKPATVQPPRPHPAVNGLVFARMQSTYDWTAAELENWLDRGRIDEQGPQSDGGDAPVLAAEIPSWVFATNSGPVNGENHEQ